jgi:quercetin 2,3-dioxygenase
MTFRQILEVRAAHPSRDGDGVAIQRIAGMRHANMDPLLMIDELHSDRREDFAGGFPPHPHRGMQTLTYMKNGGIRHEDSEGNRGEIRGGGAQWMSAGRGVIHSEMPTQDSEGLHGFQLWINLPRSEKMSAPRYRDIPAYELTRAEGGGSALTVIAGDWRLGGAETRGPLHELAPRAAVADLVLQPGVEATLETPATESVMAYVYAGALLQGGYGVGPQQLAVSGSGDRWTLRAGAAGASALLLRGNPLREPVAHYGPFVMNTAEEVEQALRDYQSGSFLKGEAHG